MNYLRANLLKFMITCSFIVCFFSCSNLPEEDHFIQGKIPISLSAGVYVSHTRAIGSHFEPDDAIGLYI
ncbi:hypothetical protein EZS27_038212, partial [termite gut metagenome]